ncbi:MAG: GlxA family transcriptional regulator [Jatrophihabitans sp.]
MTTTVVFAVPDGVHLLDLAGPAQAFSTAIDMGVEYRLVYVGDNSLIDSHQGVALQVTTEWPLLEPDDLVIVPGRRVGDGPPSPGLSSELIDLVAAHHGAGGRVASVCSGAFDLAEAKLLDGRRATTHHDLQDVFARKFPLVRVIRDVLYVVEDRIATSAGVASGIDLALHLIAVDHGASLAARIGRSMVIHNRRNGSSPQESVMLRHRDHMSDIVHRVQDTLDARFAELLLLQELAQSIDVSERTLRSLSTLMRHHSPIFIEQMPPSRRAC